jgi:hypothetical protein
MHVEEGLLVGDVELLVVGKGINPTGIRRNGVTGLVCVHREDGGLL